MNKEFFSKGVKDGLPIALGYFAVSFSLGIIAKKAGISPFLGFFSSFLNHASAGEYALYSAIEAGQTFIEIALILFVINARYLLMSCALSQKIRPSTSLIHRILLGFSVTDEIFGISVNQKGFLNPFYTYGAMSICLPFWSLGTALGIFAGNILPLCVVTAFSVALYGMFIAIIIPPARKNKTILVAVIVSFILSYAFSVLPVIKNLSSGNRMIILTILISSVVAILKPISEDDSQGGN